LDINRNINTTLVEIKKVKADFAARTVTAETPAYNNKIVVNVTFNAPLIDSAKKALPALTTTDFKAVALATAQAASPKTKGGNDSDKDDPFEATVTDVRPGSAAGSYQVTISGFLTGGTFVLEFEGTNAYIQKANPSDANPPVRTVGYTTVTIPGGVATTLPEAPPDVSGPKKPIEKGEDLDAALAAATRGDIIELGKGFDGFTATTSIPAGVTVVIPGDRTGGDNNANAVFVWSEKKNSTLTVEGTLKVDGTLDLSNSRTFTVGTGGLLEVSGDVISYHKVEIKGKLSFNGSGKMTLYGGTGDSNDPISTEFIYGGKTVFKSGGTKDNGTGALVDIISGSVELSKSDSGADYKVTVKPGKGSGVESTGDLNVWGSFVEIGDWDLTAADTSLTIKYGSIAHVKNRLVGRYNVMVNTSAKPGEGGVLTRAAGATVDIGLNVGDGEMYVYDTEKAPGTMDKYTVKVN